MVSILTPEGVAAISRGLSEAIPPVVAEAIGPTPEGSQQHGMIEFSATPSGVECVDARLNRGYRYAQPPANGFDPSGVNAANRRQLGTTEWRISE